MLPATAKLQEPLVCRPGSEILSMRVSPALRWMLSVPVIVLGFSTPCLAAPPDDGSEAAKSGTKEAIKPSDRAREKHRQFLASIRFAEVAIRPLPLTPIPDDPPPHEGAMIDLPYIIEPPDVLIVEVLEALPGRPISGERLVRPDGTIGLGFYGDIHVKGLTTQQAKIKIIEHLRRWLSDEDLGLKDAYPADINEEGNPVSSKAVMPPPLEENQRLPRPEKTSKPSADLDQIGPKSSIRMTRLCRTSVQRTSQASDPSVRPLRAPRQEVKEQPPSPPPSPAEIKVEFPVGGGGKIRIEIQGVRISKILPLGPQIPDTAWIKLPIAPADSNRVFVDVKAYNSKFYYVQGEVARPGRLPWTGHETILDALIFGNDLISFADPNKIRLVRPTRGGKPMREYPVDIVAIREGGSLKANYQIFPGDRIVVGRRTMVRP
jgi:protein involved in polysaccharide export with SLBB domain